MKLLLSESKFNNLFKIQLFEDLYSTPVIRRTIKLITNKYQKDVNQARQIVDGLMKDLEIHNTKDPRCKFILGCARIFCDGEIRNENNISQLKTVLKYVASEGHFNEYSEDLNGETLETLYNRFHPLAQQDAKQSRDNVASRQYQDKGYRIMKIDSEDEAEAFGDYTSWCITHGSFDSYRLSTFNQCYFCLKPGFEKINYPSDTSKAPFDEYGLSMISVIVDEEGEPKYITTRYNHDFDGENNPNLRTPEQVSELIGVNFYETFKPSSKWQEMLEYIKQRLANGEDPQTVFDEVWNFSEGFANVKLNGKWNFINTKGQLISEKWFDYAWEFSKGFAARVQLNDKWNFINTKGQLISEKWFDYISDFSNGFASVELNDKHNLINAKGQLISEKWFDDVCNFSEGFACVVLNNKYNFINTKGQLISENWFEYAGSFSEGFARVRLNKKFNCINTKGLLISEKWFDYACNFLDGFCRVMLNNKFNFINTKAQFISEKWFDAANDFSNGLARVQIGEDNYQLDTNGNLHKSK